MFLLDTNVVSDVRRDPGGVAANWLRSVNPDGLYLSVIAIGEVERGIVMRERTDRKAAAQLSAWLHALRTDFGDRILPIDSRAAMQWGRIKTLRTRSDADILIAATARVHDLILVTRNVRDFDDLAIPILDPWDL